MEGASHCILVYVGDSWVGLRVHMSWVTLSPLRKGSWLFLPDIGLVSERPQAPVPPLCTEI